MAAPADTPFTIKYKSDDTSYYGTHNITIKDGVEDLFKGEIIGPTTITHDVPALPAGIYKFLCTQHPFMTGDFLVD